MTAAIRVHNLSKQYVLRHEQKNPYGSLRDSLSTATSRLVRAIKHPLGGHDRDDQRYEEFWALDDVSFEVEPGERVGIIGRNGAGKSTLLKILSRITAPTKGQVTLKGRVASLLEVGTGFHPELTGRENIYLNGAILGMGKAEIRRKFDAIVDFAEVEKFLDTPVKRYSSGMYVRLAFAVAAHLETDILVVDEVLAVGDAGFQKKCMAKMESVAHDGRTILFVSHNMGAVAELCSRAILLGKGKVLKDGAIAGVIEEYIAQVNTGGIVAVNNKSKFPIYVTEIKLYDAKGVLTASIPMGSEAVAEISYSVEETLSNVTMAMLISRNGTPLLYSYDHDMGCTQSDMIRSKGEYVSRIKIPTALFKEGQFSIHAAIGVGQSNMTDENASMAFEIFNHSINSEHKSFRADRQGHLYMPLEWETRLL
jgi:lipopolysaccharide transport system ATP-binding protein